MSEKIKCPFCGHEAEALGREAEEAMIFVVIAVAWILLVIWIIKTM